MGYRIPEDELRRIKQETDLVALVEAAGVVLVPCGADFRGLCPAHEEKTPSFVVTPSGPDGWGLYRCFGCGIAGSAIDLVMLTQKVSTRHAIEILRSKLSSLPILPRGQKGSTVRRLDTPFLRSADDQALLNQVVDFYHETLKGPGGELARQYLSSRGLVSSELVDRFKLGFVNRTLCYRLPVKKAKEGAKLRARLTAIGILREKTGHEHFRGAITFPILDPGTRNVLGIYARRVEIDHHMKVRHLYLKGPHRGVWNEEGLAGAKEAVITEGIIDAATFWCAGHRHVVAAYGADCVTEDHLRAFQRHGVEKVIIAFDRDEGGDKGTEALAPRLARAGIDVYRAHFPRTAKDANDYARKVTPAAESLGLVLRSARFTAKGTRGFACAETPSQAGRPVVPSALGAGPADGVSSASLSDATREEASAPRVEVLDAAAAPPAVEPLHGTCEPSAAAAAPPPTEPVPNPSPAPEPLPLAAAPCPPEDGGTPVVSVNGDEVTIAFGDRVYRVLDLWRNTSLGRLEVSLRVGLGEAYFEDILELRKARARETYIAGASAELSLAPEVVKKDLGRLLLEVEDLQQKRLARGRDAKPKHVEIPPAEKAEAFALLHDPRLLDRVVEDFDRIGLVGERKNKLVAFLAAVSRKMDDPLALLIQSNSAAGKSALMDAVLALCPAEDVERFTAMTAQSVYYMADVNLKHRILAIAEVAGAEKAGYPIKCLQSDGRISIATTVKDPDTGEMKTKRHDVEGPVAIMLTTTAGEIDEELQNRAIVLTVNEDREQTRAIHDAQRHAQTLPGMLARRRRQAVVRLHQNAQRLLRPLVVVNPYADGLTFLDTKLRTRRDHVKFLAMIRAIALLHQYQRPVKETVEDGEVVSYVEVSFRDVEVATALAEEVFGRSLDDLAPQTRRLLELLDEMVRERCAREKVGREDLRFTRREVREHTKWAVTQTRVHLDRLVDLEYLIVHRGRRGNSFVYELVYDGKGKDGRPTLPGLVDVQSLRRRYDPQLAGRNGQLAAP